MREKHRPAVAMTGKVLFAILIIILLVIHANLSLLRIINDSTEPFSRGRRKNAKILTWNQYQIFFWVQTALRLTLSVN